MTKTEIKELLDKYDLEPKKHLGQNFLIDQNILDKIVKSAKLTKKDTVLEVGPGLGNLTGKLARQAKKVVAIEKDRQLIEPMTEILREYDNIEIVQGDILKLISNSQFSTCLAGRRVSKQIPNKYKVIANLPYYLTSALIRNLLETKNPPSEIILMIQKEVAQRICAAPPRMNLLAIAVQLCAKPKILFSVSHNCFWPKPKVDSAVIKITPSGRDTPSPRGCIPNAIQLAKAGFSSPRKQLANNLMARLKIDREQIKKALSKTGLNPQCRAENLSVDDWRQLAGQIKI